uniref:alpha/beta hydrolase family esterase n=1 Tax=uncultured Draconibacterium sp. TaxID=1573823 RepID=UPI003216B4A5
MELITRMKHIISLIFILLISVFAYPQLRTVAEYITVDGRERYYELFVPQNYTERGKLPVVFVFHGGGGTAKGMIRHTKGHFNKLANRDGFIVVYPNGFEKGWNDGARDSITVARRLNINDVAFFEEMLNDLTIKFPIDIENVFACGISNGGFMVQRLAYELPERIKGVAVVAANLSVVQSREPIPQKPVSVLFICGTKDPLVPYNGGYVTVFRQKRGKVLSVKESIEIWKNTNGCYKKAKVFSFPDQTPTDGCNAIKTVWLNEKNPEIKVIDIRIENGGHTWPGTKPYLPKRIIGNTNGDFNGCDEIWSFFNPLK